jgi:S-formylglutathione hydrolase FrmB
LDKLNGSENDPKFLISRLKREEIPALYLCCGVDDFLIEQNRDFHKFLREKNVAHTYVEGAGGHTWEFWDEYILKVRDWFFLGH